MYLEVSLHTSGDISQWNKGDFLFDLDKYLDTFSDRRFQIIRLDGSLI